MDDLNIKPTKYTPAISFDQGNKILEIRGMSYPPDIAETYDPFFSWLDEYLGLANGHFTVNIELSYLNSSSYRVLLRLFEKLEEESENGRNIVVNWIYDPEDDDKLELGEEFQEEMKYLAFHLKEKDE